MSIMLHVVVHLPSGKEIDLGQLPRDTTFAKVRRSIEGESQLVCNVFKIVQGVTECSDCDVIGSDAESSQIDLSVVVTSRDSRVLREPQNPTRLMELLTTFSSHQMWILGKFSGDDELHAVFDRLCSAPEKQVYTPQQGSEYQEFFWRLPLDAGVLMSVVPWQKTFGIDPLEIEAVLSLVGRFGGFLDVRDGGGRVNAVVALANGDLVAARATYNECCGFVQGRDLVCSATVRAKSMDELSCKAGGFLKALQGESVGEWKLHFGGLQISFAEDAGIPLDFWRKQQYRSCIGREDSVKDLAAGVAPSSCLLEHPMALPKIVKRAIQVAWEERCRNSNEGDALSVLGGRSTMSYEDWMREFGEQHQHELVKDFLKHVKAARLVIKLAEQQAAGGKIDKLQEGKLANKCKVLQECVDVARYVDEGSELWNKGKDVMENSEMREMASRWANCM